MWELLHTMNLIIVLSYPAVIMPVGRAKMAIPIKEDNMLTILPISLVG